MGDLSDDLNRILERLEANLERSRRTDAIDAILAGSPRKTNATSLRDHEVVQQFHRELSSGLIRVDTVSRLLGLIRMAVEVSLL